MVIRTFSCVSIVGMPSVIYTANHLGWHYTFWSVALICAMATCAVRFGIAEVPQPTKPDSHSLVLHKPLLVFNLATGIANFSPFLIIPILVPILTQVLHLNIQQAPALFLCGGNSFTARR
ncbi:mxck [Yersinia nurmii]|nr:mxck [Yersinia nurmii]